MRFAQEPYSEELIQQMMPLWKKHHEEVAAYKDILLDPELTAYQLSAANGALRIFTCRQGKELKGYQVFFVTPHPHSKGSLQAVQDIVYVDKESRRGLAGYKFLKWCSDDLLKEGVQVVYQHISADHDFGPVLRRIGYELVDLVYGRRLCQQPSL